MIEYNVFPGGKRRVVTFSYDDGHPNDERLIAIMNKYGVKGSFHINGFRFKDASPERRAHAREVYSGHEISCHTVSHGWPAFTPNASLAGEVMEDRKILEEVAGYPVIGMSYPSGSFDERVEQVLAACGIVYSRTTLSHGTQKMPEDFLAWHPTCHQSNAQKLADAFMQTLDSEWYQPLLYIWGHSHEFRTEEDWQAIEKVIATVAGSDRVWYATNIDIWRYTQALKLLEISADEKTFYNPTATDLWVARNKHEVLCIPAGQRVTL